MTRLVTHGIGFGWFAVAVFLTIAVLALVPWIRTTPDTPMQRRNRRPPT